MSSGSEEELELLIVLHRRRKKKKRNMWVRPIFSLCRKQGKYHNLLQEMRMSDQKAHFRYIGMSKERFDSLYIATSRGKYLSASISFSSPTLVSVKMCSQFDARRNAMQRWYKRHIVNRP